MYFKYIRFILLKCIQHLVQLNLQVCIGDDHAWRRSYGAMASQALKNIKMKSAISEVTFHL